MSTIASRRCDRHYFRPRWQVCIICCCLSWRSRYVPPALEGRQSHRDTSGRAEAPLYFSVELRFHIRFLEGPFHHRLCASRRSRRPLSSESEINPSSLERRRLRHPDPEPSQGGNTRSCNRPSRNVCHAATGRISNGQALT